jgi:drug/metabolite transporter (DMT)-like permease
MRLRNSDARLGVLVVLVLLVCGLSGGSSFLLVKSLVTEVTPLQLVAGRVALAGTVLTVGLLAARRYPRVDGRLLRGAGVLAVIDVVVPYSLVAFAAAHILASTSALLISTMPIFTSLFVSVTDRTRVAMSTLVGLAIGIVGVAILAGPSVLDFGESSTLAMLAVVLAAASLASAAVYSRVPLRTTDPIGLSAVKFAIAGVVLVPAVAWYDGAQDFIDLDAAGWLRLLGVGVIVTAVARCGYVWVISVAGSVSASMLTYIIPAAALVLGLLLMDETMNSSKGFAVALVAASVTSVLFGSALFHAVVLPRLSGARARYETWRSRLAGPVVDAPGEGPTQYQRSK